MIMMIIDYVDKDYTYMSTYEAISEYKNTKKHNSL
jgi:hypothetical protein